MNTIALSAGAHSDMTFSGSPLSDLPVGSYSVRVCADMGPNWGAGTADESNEENNCGDFATVTINPQPAVTATIDAHMHDPSCVSSCFIDVSWSTSAPGSMIQLTNSHYGWIGTEWTATPGSGSSVQGGPLSGATMFCVADLGGHVLNKINGNPACQTVAVPEAPPPPPAPTATMTANGQADITVTPGTYVTYAWTSTGADTFHSTYSSSCGSGDWTSAAGNSENGSGGGTVISAQVPCGTYTLTYFAGQSSTGAEASDTVHVTVVNSRVDGVCGPSNGQTFSTGPDSGLCSSGNASEVSGGSSWTWSCAGLNQGGTAQCSASKSGSSSGGSGTGTLHASPNPCSIASGQTCLSTITWSTTNVSHASVYVTAIGVAPRSVFATALSGSQNASWILATGDYFELINTDTNVVLSSVTVNGTAPNTNGACGSANQTYPEGSTSYGPDTYCASGIPSGSPAFPSPGDSANWTCLGTGTGANSPQCTVSVEAPSQYSVTVTKTTGGSVKSVGNVISCGSVCAANFAKSAVVTLTPTPASTYWRFDHWTGDCSGTGSCVLILNSDKSVNAVFVPRSLDYGEF